MSKKKKSKKIDIYDVDHPFRRTAIDIIKAVIEPLIQRGINGEQYYNLENSLTIAIDKRLNKLIKIPLKPDTGPSLTNKIYECDDEDNWNSNNDECYCELDSDGDCCNDDCDCPCHH